MRARLLRLITIAVILILLSACSASVDEVTAIREKVKSVPDATYVATVTASFPKREAEFVLKYARTRDGAGRISVINPAEVAGVALEVSDDGGTLTFDGAKLMTGELDERGTTPFSALPALVRSWSEDEISEAGKTRIFGRDAIMLVSRTEDDFGKTEYRTWFSRDTYSPLYAETFSDGRRVITCRFEGTEHGT